jgi:hypothetical protein
MRSIILILIAVVFAGVCHAQAPQTPTSKMWVDTTAAATTWHRDSIGPKNYIKYVEIQNYGLNDVYVAMHNDTVSGQIMPIPGGTGDNNLQGLKADVTHIYYKTKTGTSRVRVVSKW